MAAGAAARRPAWRPSARPRKRGPAAHGPAGHTGRRTWPGRSWRGCVSRARRRTCLEDALLGAEPGAGRVNGRPLGAQARARRQRAAAGLAGRGGDHAAGHGALGGPGLRGAEQRRGVPAGLGQPGLHGIQPCADDAPPTTRCSSALSRS